MSSTNGSDNVSPVNHRQELIEKYWADDMARKVYLLRRQRKVILENCRRIAVAVRAAFLAEPLDSFKRLQARIVVHAERGYCESAAREQVEQGERRT